MTNLATVELKAFVPSKDFELCKQFYQDLGFTVEWSNEGLAYIRHGESKFLLQKYYVKEFAENLMMHLLVEDVDAWWKQVNDRDIISKYGVRAGPPEQRPWGIRDFVLFDPTGVLWRIGQTTKRQG
jgi:hypothetical protein